jgi:hypothetical protein
MDYIIGIPVYYALVAFFNRSVEPQLDSQNEMSARRIVGSA